MRRPTNGFRFDFATMSAFLNTFFMVGAESVTLGVGGDASENPLHDPTRMPIATPIGSSDSLPITSTSTTGSAQGSSASTRAIVSPSVIAGVVVSAVVLLMIALIIFVLCRRERRRQRQHRGPVNLTLELDRIGSPVYEKRFIPSPFLTDTEAMELGYDQHTRRIEATFIPVARLHSAHLDAQLTVPSAAYVHVGLPVLLSNSGYSLEPLAGSRTTFSTQKLHSASSQDYSIEEAPPQRMRGLLAQLAHDIGPNSNDPNEDSVPYVLGGEAKPVYNHRSRDGQGTVTMPATRTS